MKLNVNFWGIIFYLFLIVCGVLVSGLAIQLASSLIPPTDPSTGVMQYVSESNEMAPIQEIAVSHNQSCPTGFEALEIGMWPGSRLGCYVQKGVIGESCIEPDIPAQPEKAITKWGNLTFCVKRNVNYEFMMDITCNRDFVQCSRELCVSKLEKCPITSITPQTQQDFVNAGKPSQDWLHLEKEGKMLKIDREDTEQPIFNLETSILGQPCYAKGWAPYKENPYKLLEIEFKCGKYGEDPKATILDSYEEIDLYIWNGFDTILRELKGYNDSIAGDHVYLVTRHRPALSHLAVCYDNHPANTELNNLKVIDVWGEWIFTLSILELLAVVPLGMFLHRDIQRKGDLKRLSVAIKVALFNPVSTVAMVFYLRIYLVLAGVKQSSGAFLTLAANGCFIEEKLNEAAIDFADLVKNYYYPNYSKIGLVVWFVSSRFLGSMIMAFYKHNESKKGLNLHESRNRSVDRGNWFFMRNDDDNRQYLSI